MGSQGEKCGKYQSKHNISNSIRSYIMPAMGSKQRYRAVAGQSSGSVRRVRAGPGQLPVGGDAGGRKRRGREG